MVWQESDKRRVALARWGLIPRWVKNMDTGYPAINARAETVAYKPVFRDAYISVMQKSRSTPIRYAWKDYESPSKGNYRLTTV
jgi:Uncharacterized conserved protein